VIELNIVDRFYCGIGIRVGGKKRPLGAWIQLDRFPTLLFEKCPPYAP
jgi:hypothetical protein